jgi:hypothetical protein
MNHRPFLTNFRPAEDVHALHRQLRDAERLVYELVKQAGGRVELKMHTLADYGAEARMQMSTDPTTNSYVIQVLE